MSHTEVAPCQSRVWLDGSRRRPSASGSREWHVRTLAVHEKNNETFRRMGWPERPPPDIEPGWFERLQARAEAATRPRTGGDS